MTLFPLIATLRPMEGFKVNLNGLLHSEFAKQQTTFKIGELGGSQIKHDFIIFLSTTL